MILPGRLRSTTLGDVLGTLLRAKVSGELELIGHEPPYQGRHHFLSLQNGVVSDVRTPLPTPPIGEILLEKGKLSPKQHRQFLTFLQSYPDQLTGHLLVNTGLISHENLVSGLKTQNRLRLDALFQLTDADLRFHPMRKTDSPLPPLQPSEYLHDRPRARCRKKVEASSVSKAFATLGLPANSNPRQAQQAFRRLAASSHPDLFPNVSPTTKRRLETRFSELSEAYHTIVKHG